MSTEQTELNEDITSNALHIQALHLLNDAIDKDRYATMSKSLLRNRIMMLWMATPENKAFSELLDVLDKGNGADRLERIFALAQKIKGAWDDEHA